MSVLSPSLLCRLGLDPRVDPVDLGADAEAVGDVANAA